MSYCDRIVSKNNSCTLQQRFGNTINRKAITPETRTTERNYSDVFSADRLKRKKTVINESDDPLLLITSKKLKFENKFSPLKNVLSTEIEDMQAK